MAGPWPPEPSIAWHDAQLSLNTEAPTELVVVPASEPVSSDEQAPAVAASVRAAAATQIPLIRLPPVIGRTLSPRQPVDVLWQVPGASS